ncbi:mucin-associated surface protein [Arthrobacter sp. NPDC057013]|uniref:mucin-associated surface protein n=1 Tax=Arthrobacter sp. NPDC057013 TaxID=3345999 RepID=UPI00362A31DF
MSPRRTPAVWRRGAAVLTGYALAAALAGCAGAAPDLEADAAAKLQQRVLEVTKSAAESNPAAALKSLASLSSALDAAAAAGQVSFKRHRSITAAINSVRADLTAAQAAKNAAAKAAAVKATPAPKPSPTTAPAVVVPAPAPAPAPAKVGKQASSGKSGREANKDRHSGKNKG